jgi:cell division protein FtsI (penicillin-binding protein 3)
VLEFSNVPVRGGENKSWIEMENNNGEIVIDDLQISRKTVPDVRGMGARDAIYILENLGMIVSIEGYGRVMRQSIKPGTKNRKEEIVLFLK